MKVLIIIVFFIFCLASFFIECTDKEDKKAPSPIQDTFTIYIPKNEKFIDINWKNNCTWILTKDTLTNVYHYKRMNNTAYAKQIIIHN